MKPLVLYPAKRNLMIGIAIGLGFALSGRAMIAGAEAMNDAESVAEIFGLAAIAFGLWTAAACGFRLAMPSPVFEARSEGFRVMNKKLQPWDRFHGVGEHKMRIYFIPMLTWVVVKVGKSKMFARRKHIKWIYLPGKSRNVAEEIAEYAWRVRGLNRLHAAAVPDMDAALLVKRNRDERAAQSAARPGQPVRVKPAAAYANDGPVREVPSVTQRLFGQKVNRL